VRIGGKVSAKTIRIVISYDLKTIRLPHLESTTGARGAGTQMHARGEPGLRPRPDRESGLHL
jgi:hypothetical protein